MTFWWKKSEVCFSRKMPYWQDQKFYLEMESLCINGNIMKFVGKVLYKTNWGLSKLVKDYTVIWINLYDLIEMVRQNV